MRFADIRAALKAGNGDRKSTRLNSSHLVISYAAFCLQKKQPSRHRGQEHFAMSPNVIAVRVQDAGYRLRVLMMEPEFALWQVAAELMQHEERGGRSIL